MIDGGDVNLENEAVLAGDAVTFDDFGNLLGQFCNPGLSFWE